eukprot:15440653-Alexandrium_andersonii.AAC.1
MAQNNVRVHGGTRAQKRAHARTHARCTLSRATKRAEMHRGNGANTDTRTHALTQACMHARTHE